jgi:hypothetical protein
VHHPGIVHDLGSAGLSGRIGSANSRPEICQFRDRGVERGKVAELCLTGGSTLAFGAEVDRDRYLRRGRESQQFRLYEAGG